MTVGYHSRFVAILNCDGKVTAAGGCHGYLRLSPHSGVHSDAFKYPTLANAATPR